MLRLHTNRQRNGSFAGGTVRGFARSRVTPERHLVHAAKQFVPICAQSVLWPQQNLSVKRRFDYGKRSWFVREGNSCMVPVKQPKENDAALGVAPTAPAYGEEPRTMTAERDERPNPFRALNATAAAPTMPSLEPGMVVKHYEFLRLLGAGGMGKVFLARDTRLGRFVAVKLLLNYTGRAAHRFLAEARTTAQCRHENIVVIYDVDEYAGYPYMVLEYIEGRTLRAVMSEPDRDLSALALESMVSVSRALECAHDMGIVHRDLKPENILLSKNGQIKALDFGIAKQVSDVMPEAHGPGALPLETKGVEQTQAGALVGTLGYMSPEQINGESIDARTDIWAVGVILYELLTGERPLKGDSFTQVASEMRGTDVLPSIREKRPELGALADIVDRCLQKRKEDRFESAKELLAALEHLVEGKPKIPFGKDELAVAGEPFPQPDTLDAVVPDAALKTGDPRGSRSGEAKLASNSPGKTKRFRWAYVGAMGLAVSATVVAGVVMKREAPKPVAPMVVAGIACAAAEVTGSELPPGFADALGQGACARLGIELGVPWHEKAGMPLRVRADVRATNASRVTLELAGKTAEGTGKTSIAATNDAIQKLAPLISVPAFSAERIKGWGAKDEASARRIERGFRRVAFGFADKKSTGEALVGSDPDSAVSHALLACSLKKEDVPRAQAEKAEAKKRFSLMEEKRARMIAGGLASFVPTRDDGNDARGLTNGYSELSRDPDFAGLYTLCGCVWTDTSMPMMDWLSKNEPVMGLPTTRCMLASDVGPERFAQYLDWIDTNLPEMRGTQGHTFVDLGKLDEALVALDIKEKLGAELTKMPEVADERAEVALGMLDWRVALRAGDAITGDPDLKISHQGAVTRIRALLMGGKIAEAETATEFELDRLESPEYDHDFVTMFAEDVAIRNYLGHRPPAVKRLHAARERQARMSTRLPHIMHNLMPVRADESPNVAKSELERMLAKANNGGNRAMGLAYAMPLIRRIRGNKAAATTYRELGMRQAKWFASFEAAHAFQATGSKDEAEKAYRLSMEEPWNHSFEAIAARLRLADMLRVQGREDEARELMAIVDKAWSKADPGLREAVRSLK